MNKFLGLPIDASAHGAELDYLTYLIHLLMLALLAGWGLFFLFTLMRFRKGRHPTANHLGVRTHASSYLEGAVVITELILLFVFSIPLWSKKVHGFPPAEEAEHARVIAQQFAWNIHYPGPDKKYGKTDIALVSDDNPIGLDRSDPAGKDDVTSINQLRLPIDRPAILDLTTKDVIHSFFLPLFRVKQDTIPGMSIPVYFTPTMTSEKLREAQAMTVKLPTEKPLDLYTTMQEYKDKEGALVVKKGGKLSEDNLKKLVELDITEITVGPANPAEIACAQLCGLNHYRMKGFLTVLSQEDYNKWMDSEQEDLAEEE